MAKEIANEEMIINDARHMYVRQDISVQTVILMDLKHIFTGHRRGVEDEILSDVHHIFRLYVAPTTAFNRERKYILTICVIKFILKAGIHLHNILLIICITKFIRVIKYL